MSLAFKCALNPNRTILEALPSMAGVHLSGVIHGLLPPEVDEGQPLKGFDQKRV